MDHSEAVKIVMERISKLEPEPIVKKAIGYTYIQGFSDQEMIRLALGPDSLIHTLIQNAKNARIQAPAPPVVSLPVSPPMNPGALQNPSFQFSPFSLASVGPNSPPATFHKVDPYSQIVVEQQQIHKSALNMIPYSDYICLEDPREAVKSGPSSYPMDYYCHEAAVRNVSIRGGRHFAGLVDYPVKTCHYHNKGYCKHGINCRYYHMELFPDGDPRMFNHNTYDASGEDYMVSPGSLEKLEFEIIELLKSRRGSPVSIASLPMIYYDKYGKTLQAEGYLTESQRHGKTGYSLTKLLVRLKNIKVIDRPHGQHAVILAEDAPKYLDIRGERNDPGPIVNGSRQIYLTFPAESTFTEEDVSIHFSTFGPVQDVRIPCQQKRMFGFVTFVSAETVRLILSKGNPHFVCGARVLAKPYREKSKFFERKYADKIDCPFFHGSEPIDINMNPELQADWESARLVHRQAMGGYEQAVELEAIRLAKLQLACRPGTSRSCLGYSMEELKVPGDSSKSPSADRVNQWIDSVKGGSASDDRPETPVNNYADQESRAQGDALPDSPFASVVVSSISASI